MKKQISLLLTFFAMAIMVHAQAPNAIPYQGVARNSSGSILASQAIRLRLTIHDVTAAGTIVYQETQAVTTSTLGLFNINIGQGTIVTGTLGGVNWGGGAKFLQVEMDPTGGTIYISMGTTQLNSVPYALFAGSIPTGAGWSLSGNTGTVDGTNFIGTIDNVPLNIKVYNQPAGRIDPFLQNAFFGLQSGAATSSGRNNAAFGNYSLNANTSGFYNIAIGYEALYANTIGTGNLASGAFALYSNVSGNYNNAVGYTALYNNTTGSYNNASGYAALNNNTTGSYNGATGYSALLANTTGTYNIANGFNALYANTTGSGNLANGANALRYNTIGNYNTATGYTALYSNTSGSYNIANGNAALYSNTTGSYNTANGFNALFANTIGSGNLANGAYSLQNNTTGSYNTAEGYQALSANTTGSGNLAFGANSLPFNTTGSYNTATGSTALYTNTTGSYNNANGFQALYSNTTGGYNNAFGYAALQGNTTGGQNTANGYQALSSNTIGAYNTGMGYRSLYNNTSGAFNSALGDSALFNNFTGGFNTAHGYAALASNTTGSNNTALGDSADVAIGNLTNATAIGYNAKVAASNTIQLGNTTIDSVMAGTLSGNTKLVVPRLKITGGTLAANSVLTSDGSGNATWQPSSLSGWSLFGNAGTNPANNFIGTTDNQPFNIRINNLKAGRIDSASANSFYGLLAGGSNSTGKGNTAIGDSALFTNTTGSFNTAIGDSADMATSALTNASAIGHAAKAPASNTIQLGNTAIDSVMAGSLSDSTKLVVPRLRITKGSGTANQVLTSDVVGNATWQTLPSGLPAATAPGQMIYWNGTQWLVVAAGTRGQQLTFCEGVPTWGACPAINATLTTTAASNVLSTSASTGGNITYDGDAPVTARGVTYATTATPTISANPFTTDGTGTGIFVSSLTNLTPATLYYVRAYATNSVGTSYGNQVSFTTANAAPALTTTAVSAVASTTATSGGNITSNNGSPVTARGVVWALSSGATTTTNAGITADGTGSGTFVSSLTGLSAGTLYYVRAYATNGVGTTYGNELTFTTTNIPSLSTNTISAVTSTTASSGGNTITDGGASITAKGIVWSTSSNPTIALNAVIPSDGTGTTNYSSGLTGLSGSTTYHVRAYATNNVGTAYGADVSFTTNAPVAPTLSTTTVSSITANSASSGGNVTDNGGAPVTARGVVWSTSTGATVLTQTGGGITTNGTGNGSFSSGLTGLSGSTLYYVRAYATNSAGTTYGTEYTFTTTISVGDTYQGGTVFYVTGSPGAQHGLIASTADQSASMAWYTTPLVVTGASGTAIGTGSANTTAITGHQASGNAAATAKAYTDGTYHDWYLPSQNEVDQMYQQNGTANLNMLSGTYWSSTGTGQNTALAEGFGVNPGQQSGATSKNTTLALRAIRSF